MDSMIITFRGLRTSKSLETTIREALTEIEARAGRIDRGHIVVGPADPFRVAIDLAYRHHRVFIVRESRDVYAAVHDAMDAAERQMLELKRRQEHERLSA
jgi:ribosome-associated translation inhibitor RaiA